MLESLTTAPASQTRVETPAQLDYLRSTECEQVQGYLIAHPLPAGDVRALLAGRAQWAGGAQPAPGSAPFRNGFARSDYR